MSEAIKVSLLDAETNTSYDTLLSLEDLKKVQSDAVFATFLLQMLKRCHQAAHGPSIITEDAHVRNETSKEHVNLEADSMPEKNPETSQSPLPAQSSDPGARSWSREETLELINIYRAHIEAFTCGKSTQKTIWEKVAAAMRVKGYNFTGHNCNVKFQSLKRTYKSIKDHNSKSGNGPRKWNYYENMDELFNKKPWVAPLATASSSAEDGSQEIETPHKPDNGKRKSNALVDYLQESTAERNKRSEQRDRLHKEKMAKFDKMNELLEQLVKAQAPCSITSSSSDM